METVVIIFTVLFLLAVFAVIKVKTAQKKSQVVAAEREFVNARVMRYQPSAGWILEIWHGDCWKTGILPKDALNESFIEKKIKVSLEDFDEAAGYWRVRPMYLAQKDVKYVIITGPDEYIYPAYNGIAVVGKIVVHKGYTVLYWTELPLSAVEKMAKLVP